MIPLFLIAGVLAAPASDVATAPVATAPAETAEAKIARYEREFKLGELPAATRPKLAKSLADTAPFPFVIWRDVPALNPDGTINVYVEIEKGESTKWEFDLARNRRAVDRVIPDSLGGYPINYGFVPQTIFDDGDPFDHVMLGPKATGGALLTCAIVGNMRFVDEKGIDSKVVVSPIDAEGKPLFTLDAATRTALETFFNAYKKHEKSKGKFSRMLGFGDAAEGRRYVEAATGYFASGRAAPGTAQR
jgi:inorganic pyrophosphatase